MNEVLDAPINDANAEAPLQTPFGVELLRPLDKSEEEVGQLACLQILASQGENIEQTTAAQDDWHRSMDHYFLTPSNPESLN